MSDKQKVTESFSNKRIKIDGSNNNFGIIYGMDEKAVSSMMDNCKKECFSKLEKEGIKITNDVADKVCELIESKFIIDISSSREEKKQSDEETRKAIKENLGELQKNNEIFFTKIWGEFAQLNKKTNDVKAALSQMATKSEEDAAKVLPKLDEVLNIAKENNSLAKDTNSTAKDTNSTAKEVHSDVKKLTQKVNDIIDLQKQNSNEDTDRKLKSKLFQLVKEKNINDKEIVRVCNLLEQNGSSDFCVNFYRTVCNGSAADINSMLSDIDADKYYDFISDALNFILKAPKYENLTAINNLIERAYKNKDLLLLNFFRQKVKTESQKIDDGIYDPDIPRQCFIAYKNEDMPEVQKVLNYFDEQRISYYIAERNLPHGKISDYETDLKRAIDACSCFVFISSVKSRMDGGAREVEMRHVREADFLRAPSEYQARNDYAFDIKYKKPRVEYVVEWYTGKEKEKVVDIFFQGFERVIKPDLSQLVKNILNQIDSLNISVATSDSAQHKAEIERIREESERKAKEEAERAKLEAERKAREEADQRAKLEQELAKKRDEELRAKQEAERLAKLEAERKAKIARDFQIDSTVMVRYLGNDSRVIIPEGVTRIANYAFKGYEGIVKEVVLPSTLREVEKYWISAKITVNHDRIGWKYSENGRYKFVCIDKNKDFYKGNK